MQEARDGRLCYGPGTHLRHFGRWLPDHLLLGHLLSDVDVVHVQCPQQCVGLEGQRAGVRGQQLQCVVRWVEVVLAAEVHQQVHESFAGEKAADTTEPGAADTQRLQSRGFCSRSRNNGYSHMWGAHLPSTVHDVWKPSGSVTSRLTEGRSTFSFVSSLPCAPAPSGIAFLVVKILRGAGCGAVGGGGARAFILLLQRKEHEEKALLDLQRVNEVIMQFAAGVSNMKERPKAEELSC
ncbi:hypothetical protein JZ751_009602 [Albula glossodonta]|uniref:Uncharacterized protein n=1 Tax=Albula glossodonta TaxID=121402 RepID=A0A8T2P120_9TELE|nr:hypothetical protein JZ751_009602 [Albula glossodonta]